MQLEVVAHREASLHGAELVPGLDLRHGQGHQRDAANAMKGDLLDSHQDIVEAGVDEEDPGINGQRSRVRR